METAHEPLATRKRQLIEIVDDLFALYEAVHRLLCQWQPTYHTAFIEHCMRLQRLEAQLAALGYDDEFILTVKQAVYGSVFGN
jgi:hypothetical protein